MAASICIPRIFTHRDTTFYQWPQHFMKVVFSGKSSLYLFSIIHVSDRNRKPLQFSRSQVSEVSVLSIASLPWQLRNRSLALVLPPGFLLFFFFIIKASVSLLCLFNQSKPVRGGTVYLELISMSL